MNPNLKNVLTTKHVHELVLNYNPEVDGIHKLPNVHELLDEMVVKRGGAPLGWGMHRIKCSKCSNTSNDLNIVPVRYPCICDKCGQMTIYRID